MSPQLSEASTDTPSLTPLERRALREFTLRGYCAPSDPIACCEHCWNRWVRARLMEHVRGEHYWHELDRGDFGLLRGRFHPNVSLAADIVARLADGSENLSVVVWAFHSGAPLDDVLEILATLDVNGHRIPRFTWLARRPPCTQSASRRREST